jgi:DNA-directed RNA polymerase specialized sigma24 family protein
VLERPWTGRVPPCGPTMSTRTSPRTTKSAVCIAHLMTHDWGTRNIVQTTLVKCWARWTHIAADNPTAHVRRALMNNYFNWWRRSWIRKEHPAELDVYGLSAVAHHETIERLRHPPGAGNACEEDACRRRVLPGETPT